MEDVSKRERIDGPSLSLPDIEIDAVDALLAAQPGTKDTLATFMQSIAASFMPSEPKAPLISDGIASALAMSRPYEIETGTSYIQEIAEAKSRERDEERSHRNNLEELLGRQLDTTGRLVEATGMLAGELREVKAELRELKEDTGRDAATNLRIGLASVLLVAVGLLGHLDWWSYPLIGVGLVILNLRLINTAVRRAGSWIANKFRRAPATDDAP